MSNTEDVKRYFANRQKEIDGAALYRVLAETEKQPQMAEVYAKLAASEEKHAAGWQNVSVHNLCCRRLPATKKRIAGHMMARRIQMHRLFRRRKSPMPGCFP